MNYYERHIGDYARDAGHLTMIEHGAYTLLLDRYYSTEKPIPAAHVYRIARAKGAAERGAVDRVLAEFFTLVEGCWTKNRCEQEIHSAHNRIFSAQENGKLGGRPKSQQNQRKEKPTGLIPVPVSEPSDNPTPNPIVTGSKALQSPVSNLNPKSGDDPRKQIFDLGKSILGSDAGSLISKALRSADEATVGRVLGEMALSAKADPRAYFIAATKPKERGVVV
jgi:uncharacterized protein YdaU (DUF1376 family)